MWPSNPKDLRDLFPREIGKLVGTCYQRGHVHLVHASPKIYMALIASFLVAYTNDLEWSKVKDKVWVLSRWPRSRGRLLGVGEQEVLHARDYYRFEATITYEKFKNKYGFLKRLAHAAGHLPPKR